MREANIAYAGCPTQPGAAPGFARPRTSIAGPKQDFLVLQLVQESRYRFKKIWAGIDVGQNNNSFEFSTVLRFYRGTPGAGFQVGNDIPLGQYLPSQGQTYGQFTRIHHITLAGQTPLAGNYYSFGDTTGGVIACMNTLELEIVCDYMSIFASWGPQIWATAPTGILISQAFTHPQKMYFDYHFESYM